MKTVGRQCALVVCFSLIGSGYAQMGWQVQMSQQMFNQSMRQMAEFQERQQQQLLQLQRQLAEQAKAQQAAAEKEANGLHVITRVEFDQLLAKANDGSSLAQLENELLKYIAFVAYRVGGATQSPEKAIEKVKPMMEFVPDVEKKAKTLSAKEHASYKQIRQIQTEHAARNAQRGAQMNQMIMCDLMNGIEQSNQQISQSMQAIQNVNYSSVRPSASSYKRICPVHGQEYDIRYGSGCAWCKQSDYGGGKTTSMRCGVHGYWFDPAIGCPGCKNAIR